MTFQAPTPEERLANHLKRVPTGICSCRASASRAVPFRPGPVDQCTTCSELYKWRDQLIVLTVEELRVLSFLNSRKLPQAVSHNGQRKEWVGIGWIECGPARGDEVVVIEEEKGK